MFSKSAMTAVATAACLAASTADAGIWLGSQNVLRLGQNFPYSNVSQSNRQNIIRDQNAWNNMNLLQEVMASANIGSVTPGGFSYKASAEKGNSSYKEKYVFVYNNYVYGGIWDTPENGSLREPSGVIAWTGSEYAWFVNVHTSPSNLRFEVEKLDEAYDYYKSIYGSAYGVIIGGDLNRNGNSSYYNQIKAKGANQILPDVPTTIYQRSQSDTAAYTSNRYDHFIWNPSDVTITSTTRDDYTINAVGGVNYWRDNVSDHAGIYGYVY